MIISPLDMKFPHPSRFSKSLSFITLGVGLMILPVVDGFAQPVGQHLSTQQAVIPVTVKGGVPRTECFPVEHLSASKRRQAEELLLKICDGEALFTLIGAVKPMSSDWLSASFNPEKPDAARVNELREIVAQLHCGEEITAHLAHSSRIGQGTVGVSVSLDGVLFSRTALRRELNQHSSFWQQWALTESAEPLEVLFAIKYAPAVSRFRGYGYLYGYPDHAVNFFVEEARLQQENPTRKPAEREPVHIPTFSRETHRFVYAVSKGHQLNKADRELRTKCALILAEYKKRRQRFIGEGKAGIVELLREWFHDGNGNYSPRYALF